MNCVKIRIEYDVHKKLYNFVDVLPEVLRQYNYKTVHSAHKMVSVDLSKSENKKTIRTHYQQKYDKYDPLNDYQF